MTKQEQIKEIDKYSERRINYCVRIQEAFNYKGNYDHEDIPSILVDFEREIKNDILPKDSVVLSKEEQEKILIATESRINKLKEQIKQARKEMAEKILKDFKLWAREYQNKDTVIDDYGERPMTNNEKLNYLYIYLCDKYKVEIKE